MIHFKLLRNQRRILMAALLGISSALPMALTSSTLQAWFTQAGVGVVGVGAVTLLGMPYLWKFLWAPFIDRFVPPFLGRRRGWIAATQLGLCAGLFLLAQMNPQNQAAWMGVVALLIAFCSASQDVAIDAYRTDVLHPEERSMGLSGYIFTYRVGLLISGGIALILADRLGWRLTYECMAILMAGCVIFTICAPEVPTYILPPKDLKSATLGALQDLLARDGIVLILLFIVLYKIGDALALSLMSNFLLHTLGFSLTDLGFVYKTVCLLGTVTGALIGGILLTRLKLYKALLMFGVLQAFSNLLFMVLALVGKKYSLMVLSLFIESFAVE